MLVLSRKLHERIVLPGIRAAIEVVAIKPGVVRLGVEAPPDVTILREEVHDRTAQWGEPAPAVAPAAETELRRVRELLQNRLRIARKGLDQARDGLHEGQLHDVEVILERLAEDMDLLQRRLGDKVSPSAPTPAPAAPGRRPRKALLVEDDRNECELLAGLLRLGGVDVDTAGDGVDALNYLRARQRPDVILLDMGLPRCDGATTVRQIRRNPALAGLKIYAVSGSSPDQYNIDLGPRGIDRWFQKPVDSEALLRDLTQGLDSARTSR